MGLLLSVTVVAVYAYVVALVVSSLIAPETAAVGPPIPRWRG